jgi:hypothetical protein
MNICIYTPRFGLDMEEGEIVIEAGGAWILAGQVNLLGHACILLLI